MREGVVDEAHGRERAGKDEHQQQDRGPRAQLPVRRGRGRRFLLSGHVLRCRGRGVGRQGGLGGLGGRRASRLHHGREVRVLVDVSGKVWLEILTFNCQINI